MLTFSTHTGVNAISLSPNNRMLAAAGRSLLKVFRVCDPDDNVGPEDGFGAELYNLRSSNLKNLNFSNNDVNWSPINDHLLATAATNGAVVVWNLMNQGKSKIEHLFNDHKRTVNKVIFHRTDPNLLLSGSQDGTMKLFDLRQRYVSATFITHSESVRDCQFSPGGYSHNHFASVQETGNIEIWDMRRPNLVETNFIAHDGPIFTCEWHPTQELDTKWLATGGRDKTIKIWDLSERNRPLLRHYAHTTATVSKLKWRPDNRHHIGSGSLTVDFNVYVWDVHRPFISYATFKTRNEATTGFQWKNSDTFITSCKDGSIYEHSFERDAYFTAEHYSPMSIDINPSGDVCLAMSDFIYRYGSGVQRGDKNEASKERKEELERLRQKLEEKRQKNELVYQDKLLKTNSVRLNAKMSGLIPRATFGKTRHSRSSADNSIRATSESDSMVTGGDDTLLSTSMSDTLETSFSEMSIGSKGKLSAKDARRKKKTSLPAALSSTSATTTSGGSSGNAKHSQPPAPPAEFQRPILPFYPLQRAITAKLDPTKEFNIRQPIDYRRTPAHILQEHFRSTFSLLLHFYSEGESHQNFLSMKPFIMLAGNYQFASKTPKIFPKKENDETASDTQDTGGDHKKAREESAKMGKRGDEGLGDNEKVDTFEAVCEHNAQLNEYLQRHQVAYSWRILRNLFAPPGRMTLSSAMMATAMASVAGKRAHDASGNDAREQPQRNAADRILSGAHHPSGGSGLGQVNNAQQTVPMGRQEAEDTPGGGGTGSGSDAPSRHTSGGGAMRPTHPPATLGGRNENEEDDEEMMQIFEREHTRFRPVIQPPIIGAGPNKFACDFFDCQEIIDNSMERETLDQENRNEFEGGYYNNWELRHEAIPQRQLLVNDANVLGKFAHNPSGGDYVGGTRPAGGGGGGAQESPVSYDGDEDEVAATPAPKNDGFAMNMRYLINIENVPAPSWVYPAIVADVLEQMAANGDVQTAVTMIIVLGERMNQVPLDHETMVLWFRMYLSMLARFELWNVHNHVMRHCCWTVEGQESLQLRNTIETSIMVHCVQCQQALKKANSCGTCRLDSNACCLCEKPVRGLYVWCQGCTHGGHLQHMVEWFKQNAYCPSGCGHACEYN